MVFRSGNLPRVALCCSAPHALLQPARRALLPCASCPAAASASRPTAASASCSAALRFAPCCSQRVAPYCSQRVAPCCQARRALLQPVRRALLQPVRRALLPCASRPAAASASRPTAASASRLAAKRVAPCCSQRVAPYCSQRVAPCCPARRALLQPARCALLQPARRALLPYASHPVAASASRPTAASASRSAALCVAPCCSQCVAPYCSQRVALCCPSSRALLPCTACALLPCTARPAATTAAAAARATAAAGGDAAGSAGGAAGAGGAGGATGSAGGAAGAGGATGSAGGAAGAGAASGGQRQSLPLPDDPTPQQLREWETFSPQVLSELFPRRCVTGSVEAAALGACESTAALGASESAAALGASDSAAALGARASPTTGPSSLEALHTFTLDLVASRCFFRDCTTLTPLAALVPVSLADPTGGPVVARASTVLPWPAVPSGSLSCLHLPTFWTNLVSYAAIQNVWVDTFIPGGQRVAICTCSRTGRHLATFTRRPGSSLYTLTTTSAQVAEAGQTLHMDVWGPARVRGQGHERYFLLVVDDYSRYTTVFPLRSKGEVTEGIRQMFTLPASPQQNGIAECRIGMVMDVARTSMIHAAAPHFLWPFAVQYAAHQINLQPRVSLPETTPTLRWTGKVGDASAFRVWGSRAFVRDATADKLSSRAVPSVFLGFPPDAPGWQFYHPTSRRNLSSQDVTFDESVSYYRLFPHRTASPPPPPLFLAPGPPLVDPLPPQGPAPSGVSQVDPAEPVEVAVDSGAARGAETGGVETGGAETGGAESGGAETGRVEPGGVAPEGTVSGGALDVPLRREPLSPQRLREWYSWRCRVAAGADAAGAGGAGGAASATGGAAGAGAAGGAAGAGAAGAVGGAAGATGGASAAGGAAGATGGAGAGVVSGGAARPRPYFVPLLQQVLGSPPSPGPPPPPFLSPPPIQSQSQLQPASPLPGPSPYTGPTRGLTERREPESRPVSPESRPASPVRTVRAGRRVPLPSPHASSLPDGPDPESDSLRAASPFVIRFLATAVTGPLFESSTASALIAELLDFAAACRLDYAASLVAESVSASVCPPSVGGECALGMDVLEDREEEFECFATALPHLVSMLLAPEGDPDALDIPTPRSYVEAIEGPYSSQWQAAMDAEMASWKSTGTYVDEVPPPGANIVSGMWIFRVKQPPGSPPAFKARYVARGFSQRQGVDFFHTFSPTLKMTTLRVLLHVAAQRDYELHSLDFSTAFLQGSLHEEIWLRRPPGFTGSFPAGTQWSLRRPVYGLRQAPREWHDMLRTTLAALGFAPSTADPFLFLRTDATLPPFYVLVYVDDLVFATADTEALAHVKSELQKRHTCTDLGELTIYLGLRITRDRARRTITVTQSHMVQQVLQRFGFTYSSPQSTPLPTGHSLSAPPLDESVEPSGPYPELVGCLMYLMTCTRPDLAYPLSLLARYVAPGRHRKVHWDAAKRVLRYLCSTSGMGLVLGGRARVVLTGHADASWELRWLTYLLTDLGEAPRSPPVLYVDNKAMLALCQEHRLEHRTKHIALRYFLARELQQRGQLRLTYVASQAITADVFIKALQPCDHQRFCIVFGLVPTVPHLLTS
ncbi:unnamed protein product [Closterium sp. NIES-54]